MPTARELYGYQKGSAKPPAPKGTARQMYGYDNGPTPEQESGQTVDPGIAKAANSAFTIASYPMKALFVDLPRIQSEATGSMLSNPTGIPGMPFGPGNTAQMATGTAPTTAEELARREGRAVTEGFLPPGAPEVIDAVTRSPIGSAADFLSSPLGQGLGIDIAAGEAMNIAGGGAIAPAARAIGQTRLMNQARGLPIVRDIGNKFSRGFSITDPTQRAALRASIEQRMGEEALENARLASEDALRSEQLGRITGRTGESPEAVQERIRTALENVPGTAGQSFRGLASDERRLATSLEQRTRMAPRQRVAASLDPWELNAEIERLRREAQGFRAQQSALATAAEGEIANPIENVRDINSGAAENLFGPGNERPLFGPTEPTPTPRQMPSIKFRSKVVTPRPRPGYGRSPNPMGPEPIPGQVKRMFPMHPERQKAEGTLSGAEFEREAETAETRLRTAIHDFEERSGLRAPRVNGRIDIDKLEDFLKSAPKELAAFRPRVARRVFQERIGIAKGQEPMVFNRGPRGASTSPGHERISDPRMTTSQVEAGIQAKIPGMQNEAAFRPEIEATHLAARHAHREIANANILKDAMRYAGTRIKPGDIVPEGFVRLDKTLLGAKTGFNDARRLEMESTVVPKDVAHGLQDYAEAMSPSRSSNGIVSAYEDMAGAFTRVFKPTATTVNPRFTIRNAESGIWIGVARGNRDPRNIMDAVKAYDGMHDLVPVRGLRVRFSKLRDEAIEDRIIGGGMHLEGLPGGKLSDETFSKLKDVTRATMKANQAQEDLLRLSFYIHRRRQGWSRAEAAKDVARTYFNYSKDAFTASEGWLRRNMIPFYSWQRRILPLALRSVGETPGAFTWTGNTLSSVSLWNGMAPEEVQFLGPDMLQQLAVALPAYPGQKPEERHVMGTGAIPMLQDVNAMTGTRGRGLFGITDNMVSSSVLNAPLGIAARRDFYRGSELNGSPVELPVWLKPMVLVAPGLAKKLDMSVQNGRVVGTDFTRAILNSPGPLLNASGDLASAASGDANARRRAFAWLTAVNQSVRDINTGARIQRGIALKEGPKKEKAERFKRAYLNQRFKREDELNSRIAPQP